MWRLLRDTCYEFSEDECPRLAASLAYYAIFSLPALLVVIVSVTGVIADRSEAVQHLRDFLREFMDSQVADQVGALLAESEQRPHGWQSVFGLLLLLVGATGVLSELQTALNRAWGVEPDPKQGMRAFFIKRLLSLMMVASIALLLLVSLVLSWFLAAMGAWAKETSFAWLSSPLLQGLEHLSSLLILTLMFAAAFRFLPDVRIDWRDVALGGFITALLFVVGKLLLSWYFALANPSTAFGAAGSLALVLVWIYYSAMIFFFGAEFTQVYARSRGKRLEPEPGAHKI